MPPGKALPSTRPRYGQLRFGSILAVLGGARSVRVSGPGAPGAEPLGGAQNPQ
jgi:hypothetical protein